MADKDAQRLALVEGTSFGEGQSRWSKLRAVRRAGVLDDSIHAAECAVIMPGKRSDAEAPHGSKPSMSVTDIRLKRLQPLS